MQVANEVRSLISHNYLERFFEPVKRFSFPCRVNAYFHLRPGVFQKEKYIGIREDTEIIVDFQLTNHFSISLSVISR